MVTKPRFKFVAGSLCLDFVNTVGGREGAEILRDKLASAADLVRWGRDAGLLTAAQADEDLRGGEAFIRRAVEFRESLYRVAKAMGDGARPPRNDLETINREIAAAEARRRLAYTGGKLARVWDEGSALDRILWNVADSASVLLVSPEVRAIRQCPGDECGWLFLDTSRNGSRRWCEMRICGNRAKVRRFREGR